MHTKTVFIIPYRVVLRQQKNGGVKIPVPEKKKAILGEKKEHRNNRNVKGQH